MKTIFTTVAATLFAANINAIEIYHGLAEGNSDLSTQRLSAADFVGVQPSVGDELAVAAQIVQIAILPKDCLGNMIHDQLQLLLGFPQ